MSDIIKGTTIKYQLSPILVEGAPNTGKTSLIATAERPILVFAGDKSTTVRLGGQADIDFILCYDTEEDVRAGRLGAGLERFNKNINLLLTAKDIPYQTVGIDPYNFVARETVRGIQRGNPQLKTKIGWDRAIYQLLLDAHLDFLMKIRGINRRVIVTSHVSVSEDEITGTDKQLADLAGSIKNSLEGWFPATFYCQTRVVPISPTNKQGVEFYVQAAPDAVRRAGVKVPLGMENILGKELEPNIQKIEKMLGVGSGQNKVS